MDNNSFESISVRHAQNEFMKELYQGYINDMIDWYPNLFMRDGDDEFVFCDKFKIIYDKPLRIRWLSFAYLVYPAEDWRVHEFKFRLTSPNPNLPGEYRSLALASDIVLSDELCLILYDYDIEVENHDRTSIVRRNTITNIIK